MAEERGLFTTVFRLPGKVCDLLFGICGIARAVTDIPPQHRCRIPLNIVQGRFVRTCPMGTLCAELKRKITCLENELEMNRALYNCITPWLVNVPQEGEPVFLRGATDKKGLVSIICMNALEFTENQTTRESSSEDEVSDPPYATDLDPSESSDSDIPALEDIASPSWVDE